MDKQAFTELALAEMAAVHRLAVYLSRPQDADDLVQETYVRAFRSRDTYKPGDHGMRPWLFKILHNVLYSRLSGDQRQRAMLAQLRADGTDDGATPPSDVGIGAIDWEHVDGRLRDAIAELPLPHRTVFLLSAIEGLRYREIAAVADVPVGTVMSRLCRARAMLCDKLAGLAAEQRIISSRRAHASVPANPNGEGASKHP